MKRQLDHIKKTFAQDSNFEWMHETENKIKTDKQTFAKLTKDNAELQKIHDKHDKLLEKSEEAQQKNSDV